MQLLSRPALRAAHGSTLSNPNSESFQTALVSTQSSVRPTIPAMVFRILLLPPPVLADDLKFRIRGHLRPILFVLGLQATIRETISTGSWRMAAPEVFDLLSSPAVPYLLGVTGDRPLRQYRMYQTTAFRITPSTIRKSKIHTGLAENLPNAVCAYIPFRTLLTRRFS